MKEISNLPEMTDRNRFDRAIDWMTLTVHELSVLLHNGELKRGWPRSMKHGEPLLDTVQRCEALTQDIANAIACLTADRDTQGVSDEDA